ncbi:MAG: NAD(P)-dependent oxidoreductase [Vicinamibacteria bacterium]
MNLRTLVTGANGRVGRVLRKRLAGSGLTFASHAELDVEDPQSLRAALIGHQQIVHLATPIRANVGTREVFRKSVDMVGRILEAARDGGLQRVIIPSSISALAPDQLRGSAPVTLAESRPSDTEYGRTRIEVEGMCREAASFGLDVICIRLGMLRHPDAPSRDAMFRSHWLSHEDAASLFATCVTAPVVPGRFSLFYAVSDLPERILDTSNPLGWTPQTKAVGLRRQVVAGLHRVNTGVRGRLRLRTRLKSLMAPRKDPSST